MQPLRRAICQMKIHMPYILLVDVYLENVLTWVCKGTCGGGNLDASWRIMQQLGAAD